MIDTLQQVGWVLQNNPVLWQALCFILGACVGSFLNVVVWRLPIMLNRSWDHAAAIQLKRQPKQEPTFTLSVPASHCPFCKKPIRWFHNIPILGWLMLRGQCADCSKPISIRYPAVELATGLLSLAVAVSLPAGFMALSALGLVWVLLCIALIDWDTQLIPDVLSLPLLWAGLLVNLIGGWVPLEHAVVGAASGYLVLWFVFHGFKLATGKEGMGYGDFKLLAALGAWFGWQALPVLVLIASTSGAAYGISQRLSQKLAAQQAMAFGPWIALAGGIYLFWGSTLSVWLLQP